jgi:uncharacterized integral membrane protein (TIGR00698 family)
MYPYQSRMGPCSIDVYRICSAGSTLVSMSAPSTRTSALAPVVGPAAVAPGLAVAAIGGVLAILLHAVLPLVSALLIAIVLGVVFTNTVGPRASFKPGLAVASRRALRVGVALLGFQLVVSQVVGMGWPVLVVVVLIVGGGITVTVAIGSILGVPPARRLLIACGFSICGAAAVAAADGVTDSDEEDVAVALALVVAFGSLAMLVLPAIAQATGLGGREAGAWMGGGIHEVGQVVVAGGIIGGAALQVAVIVKLARVLMLAPVLTVMSWQRRRLGSLPTGKRPPLVPLFVVVFVVLVVLGSLLPVPGGLRDGVAQVQGFALATAMFALGCGIDVRSMRRLRSAEFLLGALSSVSVALLALPLVAVIA